MDLLYKEQENIVSNLRKLRSNSNVNHKSETQVMKRSVLGVINDNNKIGPAKFKNVSKSFILHPSAFSPLTIYQMFTGNSTKKCC